MLLNTLIAIPVPLKNYTPIPTKWNNGLFNFLLKGSYKSQFATPDISPAAVLAHLYRISKIILPDGNLHIDGGGEEIFHSLELKRPLPDLDEMPESWQNGVSDGTIYLNGCTNELEISLTARLLSSVSIDEPALRISIRAVLRNLFPPENLFNIDDISKEEIKNHDIDNINRKYKKALSEFLLSNLHFSKLRSFLLSEGENLVNQIKPEVSSITDRDIEYQSRILVLPNITGLENLMRGFSSQAKISVFSIGKIFEKNPPEIEPVYQLLPNGKLLIWRGTSKGYRHIGGLDNVY